MKKGQVTFKTKGRVCLVITDTFQKSSNFFAEQVAHGGNQGQQKKHCRN